MADHNFLCQPKSLVLGETAWLCSPACPKLRFTLLSRSFGLIGQIIRDVYDNVPGVNIDAIIISKEDVQVKGRPITCFHGRPFGYLCPHCMRVVGE